MEQILNDIEKYIQYVDIKVKNNILPTYYNSLINSTTPIGVLSYLEIEFTQIAERVRAGLDSLMFKIVTDKIQDLNNEQRRFIHFPLDFKNLENKKFKSLNNKGLFTEVDLSVAEDIRKFHQTILSNDKWKIIPSLIESSNHSKHRFFQIKTKPIILKAIIIFDDKYIYGILPSTCIAKNGKETKMLYAYFNTNASWDFGGVVVKAPESKVKISGEIDLENNILPNIENAQFIINKNALIRIELDSKIQPTLPGNIYLLKYIEEILGVLKLAHDYSKKHFLIK